MLQQRAQSRGLARTQQACAVSIDLVAHLNEHEVEFVEIHAVLCILTACCYANDDIRQELPYALLLVFRKHVPSRLDGLLKDLQGSTT